MTTFPTALSQALRELGFKTYGAQAMLLELHEGTWRRYYNGKTSPSSERLSGWLRKLHDAGHPLRATWTVETGWVVTEVIRDCTHPVCRGHDECQHPYPGEDGT